VVLKHLESTEYDVSVLRLVSSIPDLTHLTCSFPVRSLTLPVLDSSWDLEVGPSLKLLDYNLVDAVLELLLKRHAPTLEDLSLRGTAGLPASYIVRMPRLRSLECVGDNSLFELRSSPLDTLYLRAPEWMQKSFSKKEVESLLPGVVEFFRIASQLRVLYLDFHVPSLAESASACLLKTLNVPDVPDELAAGLHKFTSLRTLTTSTAPSYIFLRAVSPKSTPCLTRLEVIAAGCRHAFLHNAAIQDVLFPWWPGRPGSRPVRCQPRGQFRLRLTLTSLT